MRRNILSVTPSVSVSALASVSSPPERHEWLFPSLNTARHAHELCLALREFVWEAAVTTARTGPIRERSSSITTTATTTNNNNNDDDDICDKDEHGNCLLYTSPSPRD